MTPRWLLCAVIGLAAPVVHGQTNPTYSQEYGSQDYGSQDYEPDENMNSGPVAPSAPPALPRESPTARPYGDAVWTSGHWYWDGAQWRYKPGGWIASMPGYQFINGYWQQQGPSEWYWISGGWAQPGSTQVEIPIAVADEDVSTTQAPPALQAETRPPAPDPYYTWAPGYWYWAGSNWSWIDGSWIAPPRPGLVFVTPRWHQRGRSWHFVGGGWAVRGSSHIVVPEYRYAHVNVGWGRPSHFVHTWRNYSMVHPSRYHGYRYAPRYYQYRDHRASHPAPYRPGPRYVAPPSPGRGGGRDHDRGPNRDHDRGPNRNNDRGPNRDHDRGPGRGNVHDSSPVHDRGGGRHR